jgi:hypothetical protein
MFHQLVFAAVARFSTPKAAVNFFAAETRSQPHDQGSTRSISNHLSG